MPIPSLQSIKKRAEKEYKILKARRREHYSYARELGFPPIEAKVLSAYSKEKILELAKQQERIASK